MKTAYKFLNAINSLLYDLTRTRNYEYLDFTFRSGYYECKFLYHNVDSTPRVRLKRLRRHLFPLVQAGLLFEKVLLLFYVNATDKNDRDVYEKAFHYSVSTDQ